MELSSCHLTQEFGNGSQDFWKICAPLAQSTHPKFEQQHYCQQNMLNASHVTWYILHFQIFSSV
jgi:hypothetical protein